MDTFKYVITDRNSFAIFSDTTNHSDIGRQLFGKPVGAGFCNIRVGHREDNGDESEFVNVHCYGRSVTLDLDSREEDEKIINDKLNS